MIELTIGYVAGFIALAVVAAQIWGSTALTFVLAGQLKNTESATTWTSAGRYLQSSYWPLLLRSDSTKNESMPRRIVATTLFIPVVTILTAVAGIVTPLGLYEEDALASEPEMVEFQYVKDSSAWFAGTSTRSHVPFTRKCFYSHEREIFTAPAPCPYTGDMLIWESDGLTFNGSTPDGINITVPNIVKEIYSSGTSDQNTTISNFFDIQWRQITSKFDKDVDNGTRVTVGQFNQLESFALDDAYRAIEGLIVNAKTGGIGFRNHTIPVGYTRGMTWNEDLLFLEPDVECANTNVTIDFTMSTSVGQLGNMGATELVLTDRGGFVDINTTVPANDTMNESNIPDLKLRARSTAWLMNAYGMFLLNVSNPKREDMKRFTFINSKIGQDFKLPVPKAAGDSPLFNMQLYNNFASLYGMSGLDSDAPYDNPWNMTKDDFDWIRNLCQDTWAYDWARPNTTYVGCNIVRGAPKRVDQPTVLFDDGSRWSSPLYACASAVKATVKTVKFFHNGTAENLDNLIVQEIKDKEYRSKEEMPIWGFEQLSYRLNNYEPVWGLVNAAYEGFQNITTLKAPSFYMLGSANYLLADAFRPGGTSMNLPAAIAPIQALGTVVNSDSITSSDLFDFFSRRSFSRWIKWQNLSESEDTIPTVIKLIWTDIAASALVGTKDVGARGSQTSSESIKMKVTPTVRKVRFRYLFGIPAFLVLICIIACSLLAFASMLLGYSSLSTVGHRLKQTSVGRALTTAFYPEASSFSMSPREWVSSYGSKKLDLAGYAAPAGVPPPLPSRPQGSAEISWKQGSQYSAIPVPPSSTY